MSSKQQFKEYSTRLKAEIKTLKAENEILQKQVFRLKMQPKELNLPVVTNSNFLRELPWWAYLIFAAFCFILGYLQ